MTTQAQAGPVGAPGAATGPERVGAINAAIAQLQTKADLSAAKATLKVADLALPRTLEA